MEVSTASQDYSQQVESPSTELHGRCRWRLEITFRGTLFAAGRRAMAAWLQAVGVVPGWPSYYYLLHEVGSKTT
jgi:hypothetical protein